MLGMRPLCHSAMITFYARVPITQTAAKLSLQSCLQKRRNSSKIPNVFVTMNENGEQKFQT